jgi:hypothetical protein
VGKSKTENVLGVSSARSSALDAGFYSILVISASKDAMESVSFLDRLSVNLVVFD